MAHVRDGFSPQTNVVRQDGVRGVLLSMYKNGRARRSHRQRHQAACSRRPAGAAQGDQVKPLFDQSLFVRAAIKGVVREALIAAALTAA